MVAKFPTVAEFSRTYGLDETYVRQLLSGHRGFGERSARNMGLKIANDANLFGLGLLNPLLADVINVEPGPDIRGKVPLISWVQAGTFHEAADPFPIGEAESWIDCPKKTGSHTYALRVRGDSMTSSHGKSYPDGCVIFVDPERRSPVTGERIIAKLDGAPEVTFKVFVQDAGKTWLKPLNAQYPIITEPFKVLGTVIGKWEDE